MHYSHIVILKSYLISDPDKIKEMVKRMMEPFNEEIGDMPKWDWYRVGGRWNGILLNKLRRSDNGFNFEEEFESLTENSCLGKDVKMPFPPASFLLPDGHWYEAPMEFDFNLETKETVKRDSFVKEREAYQQQWEKALKDHAEDLFVLVDYHC